MLFSLSTITEGKRIKSCPLPGYKLVWHDEFSESAIDPSRWVFQEARAGWVNHELQTYVKGVSPKGRKVAECKKGKLRIYTFREGDKIYSGRLYGNRSEGFKYGYIEARIKLPKGKGTWPAWWMMPVNDTPGIWREVAVCPLKSASCLESTRNDTRGTRTLTSTG